MLDIFQQDAFSVTTLTDAMREVRYVPGYVSRLGLFTTRSISTTSVAIEKDKDGQISIVPASARGGPGDTVGRSRRTLRTLTVPHFQRDDAILADEVQNARQFGEEAAVETLMGAIADRAADHRQSFALTEEYHRLAVVTQGKLLDKDGSVLYNYFTEMGESQPTEVDWDLDNASPADGVLRQKAADLSRAMGATLGGLPFSGIFALCGDTFFDKLIQHKEVRDTYKGYEAAAILRTNFLNDGNPQEGIWGEFNLFGIRWANYRGGFNVGVDSDKARFVPLGVPGLFRSVYAPADYNSTVNRPGQALYANQWEMPNGKGIQMEFQTNVLHYVTRPRVLMSGRMT
ncbi:major capsid protein [Ancylobacter amanitiformis]|uniref:Major capsid protein n=1 Tax=Ancylobacter amanitiformis TaxID=217069 RepID=A0ABU0LQG8_9HYPH|nr:major capsid protein [Ancylobacter amanitiformis]MDQ0510885.1 hypothetical protein [Ancylobacter amanitiformis]